MLIDRCDNINWCLEVGDFLSCLLSVCVYKMFLVLLLVFGLVFLFLTREKSSLKTFFLLFKLLRFESCSGSSIVFYTIFSLYLNSSIARLLED